MATDQQPRPITLLVTQKELDKMGRNKKEKAALIGVMMSGKKGMCVKVFKDSSITGEAGKVLTEDEWNALVDKTEGRKP